MGRPLYEYNVCLKQWLQSLFCSAVLLEYVICKWKALSENKNHLFYEVFQDYGIPV